MKYVLKCPKCSAQFGAVRGLLYTEGPKKGKEIRERACIMCGTKVDIDSGRNISEPPPAPEPEKDWLAMIEL